MVSLKDAAKTYEPPKTLTVAELEALSLDAPIEDRTGKDKEGKNFHYKVAIVMGDEYRVPASVLTDIKAIVETKPQTKTVKVKKSGEGLNTKYTVVTLE